LCATRQSGLIGYFGDGGEHRLGVEDKKKRGRRKRGTRKLENRERKQGYNRETRKI
jgi:hypothetical protein